MEINCSSRKAWTHRYTGWTCILLLCLVLTGCNNSFAKSQYDSAEKIAAKGDRYAKSGSVLNSHEDNVTLKVDKFDGRETIWNLQSEEDMDIMVSVQFKLDAGKAKLVLIDDEGKLQTVAECTPDSCIDQETEYMLPLKAGSNRLKIVGYDCEKLLVKLKRR